MLRLHCITMGVFVLFAANTNAQQFEKRNLGITVSQPGIILADDFDGDQRLDLLLQDDHITFYKQGVDGTFSGSVVSQGNFRGFYSLSAAQIDSVGTFDLFITGTIPSGCCSRASSNGFVSGFSSVSTVVSYPTITSYDDSHTSFADMDSDGDADMLISGKDIGVIKIYENINGSLIVRSDAVVPTSVFQDGLSSWGDYDNDGDLDVAIVGTKGSRSSSLEVWRNNGKFSFTQVADTVTLCGGECRRIEWGDVDHDGDLDVLAGTGLLINSGNNSFSLVSTSIPYYDDGFTAFVDFDNDGDLDIFIAGITRDISNNTETANFDIYKNSANQFSAQKLPFDTTGNPYGTAFDYDSDGDIDIAYVGTDLALHFYENKAINLTSAKNKPGLTQAKLEASGKFGFTVSRLSEDGAATCQIAPQISAKRLNGYTLIKSFASSSDSAKFTASKVQVNSEALPKFWLKICKSCTGYRELCSNPKLIKPGTQKGARNISALVALLVKKLAVKDLN